MIMEMIARRERPPVPSARWIKVWAKRIFNFPALARLWLRHRRLAMRGAQLGTASVVGCAVAGNLRNFAIGDWSSIGSGVEIALHDRVAIGSCVSINDGAKLLTGSHGLLDPHWALITAPIVIEDFAWIAAGAIILPGVRVGEGAVVGAGAVVRVDVPPFALAIGNPAIIIEARRTTALTYRPSASIAAFEAWLGPPSAIPPGRAGGI